jgi:hypothetical protein
MTLGKVITVNRRDWSGLGPGFYIGRPTALGNPYRIGEHGNRAEVIAKYRTWLEDRIAHRDDPAILARLRRLVAEVRAGHDVILLCYCAPLPCHGDVIAEVVQRLATEGGDGW